MLNGEKENIQVRLGQIGPVSSLGTRAGLVSRLGAGRKWVWHEDADTQGRRSGLDLERESK